MKNAFKLTLLCLLGSFLLIFVSCEAPKPAAIGNDDEIIVFADDDAWEALGPLLQDVLEDTVYTPQPERWYTLRREGFDQYENYEKFKNRLVVGTLDGTGDVSEFVSASLGSQVREKIEAGEESVINKYDSKARQQLLMFLIGPNLKSLESSIRHRAQDMLYFFKKMSLRRELVAIAARGRYDKTEIQDSLLNRYGWSMTVAHDYYVAIDSASARFFWIRRANPADLERWIFVHWIDSADAQKLDGAFMIALRDSLTKRFMRTIDDDAYVQIAPYDLNIDQTSFQNRFAYEMRGNWRFSDKSGGGPFVNYTFYDDSSRRIYMLDGSIFAPRVEKKKLILQVDGLLNTFRSGKLQTD